MRLKGKDQTTILGIIPLYITPEGVSSTYVHHYLGHRPAEPSKHKTQGEDVMSGI